MVNNSTFISVESIITSRLTVMTDAPRLVVTIHEKNEESIPYAGKPDIAVCYNELFLRSYKNWTLIP